MKSLARLSAVVLGAAVLSASAYAAPALAGDVGVMTPPSGRWCQAQLDKAEGFYFWYLITGDRFYFTMYQSQMNYYSTSCNF